MEGAQGLMSVLEAVGREAYLEGNARSVMMRASAGGEQSADLDLMAALAGEVRDWGRSVEALGWHLERVFSSAMTAQWLPAAWWHARRGGWKEGGQGMAALALGLVMGEDVALARDEAGEVVQIGVSWGGWWVDSGGVRQPGEGWKLERGLTYEGLEAMGMAVPRQGVDDLAGWLEAGLVGQSLRKLAASKALQGVAERDA